jgi:hypothetical protein
MKKLIHHLSLTILLGAVMMPTFSVKSALQESPESATIITDAFGYALNSEAVYEWEDIAAAENILEMPLPDEWMLRRAITFDFPFYELTYSQIWIHIDGVLFLGNDHNEPDGVTNIQPLPSTNLPNAIIAPLWEDLALRWDELQTPGQIYFKSGGESPNKYFIIQWNNVYRLGNETALTFQVKLLESGDIIFRYKNLTDIIANIPIGIEDSDGVDGIQYLYNLNELTSGKSIYITRPADGARVKVIPTFQGGFLNKQVARFDFEVKNTGSTNDNFAISNEIINGNTSWNVRFLKKNQDGEFETVTETGTIPKEGIQTITIEISSPFAPIAGDYAKVEITFQSINNPLKSIQVHAQGAVPTSFAKVVVNEALAMNAGVWYRNQATDSMITIPELSSDNLSIMRMGRNKYLVIADNRDSGGSSNIEYTEIDTSSNNISHIHIISDNGQASVDNIIRDLYPSVSINSDGVIGIVFIREITNEEDLTFNTNIWFAAVHPDPNIGLIGPYPITNNTSYGGQQSPNVDIFTTPNISATADNSFTIVWVHKKVLPGTGQLVHDLSKTNLRINPDKTSVTFEPAAIFTESEIEHRLYQDPILTSMREGGAALVTAVKDISLNEYKFLLYYLENNGTEVSAIELERGMQGVHPDIIQLRNGNLFFGYTHPDYLGIGYSLITPAKTVHRCELPELIGEKLDQVSVATDAGGNGILTWADRKSNMHYYTLVSPGAPTNANECHLLTPPMMYGEWWVNPTDHYEHSTMAPLGSPNLFIPLIGQ